MLLIEQNFNTKIQCNEDTKKLYLQGVFMEAETKNRNGRIYQRFQLEEAVKKVNEAAAKDRHILGHLDHPKDLVINLSEVSHKIVHMEMQGNTLIGKAEILDKTPKGQIAKGLIESGVNIGVSSRGSGSVNENTGVVETYNFITADLVATPSFLSAIPSSVMEALEMYRRGELVNDLSQAVLHDNKAQKYFQKEIKRFIEELFKK